ncbi:MAG: hypothetical protein QM811_22315 [Pirellulales bacterium]
MRPFPKLEPMDPRLIAALNAKTPAEKLQMVDDMWTMVRDGVRRMIALEHPNWTKDDVQRETARRMLNASS